MLTIPIYDTILLPDVTFYFKKEVIDFAMPYVLFYQKKKYN